LRHALQLKEQELEHHQKLGGSPTPGSSLPSSGGPQGHPSVVSPAVPSPRSNTLPQRS
jgi:hypothetical protein